MILNQDFFSARANSEAVLNVGFEEKDGTIVYSKTIFGFGGRGNLFSCKRQKCVFGIQRSLYHAVQRLMNDPDFTLALLTNK